MHADDPGLDHPDTERLEHRLQQLEQQNFHLRHALRRVERIFDTAGDLVFIHALAGADDAGPFESVNSEACRRLGYRQDELLTRGPRDIIDDADVPDIGPQVLRLREDGDLVFKKTLVTRTGDRFPVEIRSRTFEEDGRTMVVSIARDMTECKRAWDYIHALIDASPDSAFLMSTDGVILTANETVASRFGIAAAADLVGTSIADLLPAEVLASRRRWIDRCVATAAPVTFTDERDGRIYRHDVQPVVSGSGEVTALAIFGRDITRERALEAEVRHAQKMDAIGQLAGGIAHDFNNVLYAVVGNLELALERVEPDGEVHGHLRDSLAACNRARDLVKRILAASRRGVVDRRPVDVRQIATEVAALLQATLPSTVEFVQDLADGCPAVMADASELHQVIMNLCTNAYQALPDGKGRVALALFSEPRSDTGDDPARVCLRVSDDGAGMTEEVVQRCCDPYFTTKEAGRGTGMGLAIVHGVVVSLGGTVAIESAPGRGTEVLIGLPAAEAAVEVAPAPALTQTSGNAAAPYGAQIMVVEDEPAILELQIKVLERAGYRVEAFGDPRQALAAFGREPGRFDLIITDQTMPGLTGADLTREALAIRPDVPVVVCSGFSAAFTPEMADALGARAYLHKPLDIAGFTAAVAAALEGSGEA